MDAQKSQQTDEILNAILPPRYEITRVWVLLFTDDDDDGDDDYSVAMMMKDVRIVHFIQI
jgi:hypothetical protein